MRVALCVEYDGAAYHGWQHQPELSTVQNKLEQAISKIANHPVRVHCAGRTDTAVHATSQIIHFDTDANRPPKAWLYGVNSHLPKDISVRWAQEVDDDFHARFSAKSRRYTYVIYNNSVHPALFGRSISWQFKSLDIDLMQQASRCLLGENDFTSFRAVQCQSNTPMRNVIALDIHRYDQLVVIDITANAFLHHMVRNIAGTLMAVGTGRQPVEWVQQVLEGKDRRLGAETAPPYGLYLVAVEYPEHYGLNSLAKPPLIISQHPLNIMETRRELA